MQSKIVGIIRVDGNAHIGMGHAMRCLALTKILKNSIQLVIATRDLPEKLRVLYLNEHVEICDLSKIDIKDEDQLLIKNYQAAKLIIFDGYDYKVEYQQKFKAAGMKIVVIDDVVKNTDIADVIINHGPGMKNDNYRSTKAKLYLGLNYVMLQPEFLAGSKMNNLSKTKKIFINIGAADPANYTKTVLEYLLELNDDFEVELVVGGVNQHLKSLKETIKKCNKKVHLHLDATSSTMAELMRHCFLGICPASTVALEAISCELPLVVGCAIDNQKMYYCGLLDLRLALGVDEFKNLNKEKFQKQVKELLNNEALYTQIQKNQKEQMDKKSPDRLVKCLLSAINN